MRMIAAVLISLVMCVNVLASPLIYKATVKSETMLVQSALIPTGKYRQLRVFVKRISTPRQMYLRPDGTYSLEGMTVILQGSGDFDDLVMGSCSNTWGCSFVVDIPSDSVRLQISSPGTFRIFVWGQ